MDIQKVNDERKSHDDLSRSSRRTSVAPSRLAGVEPEAEARPLRAVVAAWAPREGVVRMERIVAGLASGNYSALANQG